MRHESSGRQPVSHVMATKTQRLRNEKKYIGRSAANNLAANLRHCTETDFELFQELRQCSPQKDNGSRASHRELITLAIWCGDAQAGADRRFDLFGTSPARPGQDFLDPKEVKTVVHIGLDIFAQYQLYFESTESPWHDRSQQSLCSA